MFISDSLAGGGASTSAPDLFGFFIPLILIFLVFYFLLIRPQQKKMKKHNAMLSAIKRGDKIITGGGIIATVVRTLYDKELLVDLGEDQRVTIIRGTVADVLSSPEATNAPEAKKEDKGTTDNNNEEKKVD